MLKWVIGCAEHGVSPHLWGEAKRSLDRLNRLACSWGMEQEIGEEEDISGDDYYQGIDTIGIVKNIDFGDLRKDESQQYIVMLTTGYKLREAHYDAFDKMNGEFTIPFSNEDGDYRVIKNKMKTIIWQANEDKLYCAWPHTLEKQKEARQLLDTLAAETTPHDGCLVCSRYTAPRCMTDANFRARHKAKSPPINDAAATTEAVHPSVAEAIRTWIGENGYTEQRFDYHELGYILRQAVAELQSWHAAKNQPEKPLDQDAVQTWLGQFPFENLVWLLPNRFKSKISNKRKSRKK